MPYLPIPVPAHAPVRLAAFIGGVVDPIFSEVRYLLMARDPAQGPRGSMQRPLAMLLMAATDGVSQLFEPDAALRNGGPRFKAFLRNSYPWAKDPPEGFTPDEAVEFLWTSVRCPLLHRLGVRAMAPLVHKYGNLFALSDVDLDALEASLTRPYTDPSLRRDTTRTVLWIETFYWGVRQAVVASIDTPVKATAVDAWIASGTWDSGLPASHGAAAVVAPATSATP